MTVGVQADRLYIGETLVWDASAAPQDAGWVDLFDRETLGPGYTLFSTLPGGSPSVSLNYVTGAVFGGYVPAAVRPVGRQCRVFARAASGNNIHVISMYQDPNNWTSWTPDNGTVGRIRHRQNGTNVDIETPREVSVPRELGYQVTAEATTYYINRVAVATDLAGVRDTEHSAAGIGSAAAVGRASFPSLRMEPLADPNLPAAMHALDATASNGEVALALAPATEWAGARVEVETSAIAPFTAPTPEGDPDALDMARIAAVELARYPAAIHGRLDVTWRIRIGTSLVSGGPASGLYSPHHVVQVAKTPTAVHLADVSSDLPTARAAVVNHEVGHMLHISSPFTAAKTALDGAFSAANPAGFTYGTEGPRRPEGFCRGYGMTALIEDVADVFAWMQTDDLRPELITRVATDVRLRAKVAAMKTFLAASGWSPSRFADIPS